MTYSIVARDPATGEFGVAAQSHWFAVGSIVAWGRPGVGAVATQSIAEPAYGPRLLDAVDAGESPDSALRRLLADDEAAHLRQVAVIATDGPPSVHTGAGCIAVAGHVSRADFTAQANMMTGDGVPEAMAAAFESTAAEPLARRLLAALQAAEDAGGDVRGRQSASLIVVPKAGEAWRRSVDVRVDDHPDPLVELSRLLDIHAAYEQATRGDELAGTGRHDEAGAAYDAAFRLAPDNAELRFWAALTKAAATGEAGAAAAEIQAIAADHAGWLVLLERLPEELVPAAAAVREALAG